MVGRPPPDRRGQEGLDIALQRCEVDLVEGLGIVEVVAPRVGLRPVLVELFHLESIRIPVRKGGQRARHAADAVAAERALAGHLEGLGVGLVVFDFEHEGSLLNLF